MKEEMEKLGIDLDAMNATTWSYVKQKNGTDGFLYWSTEDILTHDLNDKMPVIRYNTATKTYTIWIATVSTSTTATGGDKKYQAFSTNYSAFRGNESSPEKQTYERALEIYNEQLKIYEEKGWK